MANVTDVTGGMHYLLQNDDLVMLQVKNEGGVVATSLVTLDTVNSKLSGAPKTTTISNSYPGGNFDPTGGVVASQAVGRMYNTKSDIIAAVNAVDNGTQSPPSWVLTLFDPLTGFQNTIPVDGQFRPRDTVFTQVVMGDFNGDGLADPMLFYAALEGSHPPKWGMRALTAADPKTEGPLSEGPEFYENAEPVPVTGSIVVGDFNGDGRDEIAMMLTDYQTVAFYSVDPKTLAITPVPDPNNNNQPLAVKLPNLAMKLGHVALAAGRFRNQSPGVTNSDLVVFGQIDKIDGKSADYGYSIVPVLITPGTNGNGSFTAKIVQKTSASVNTPYFRFNDKHGSSGALAQAAQLAYWPQLINEQLVLGIKTNDGASYIEIGSFVQNNKLDDFDWESETERKYSLNLDALQNMWVGNFDNLSSDGSHNAALQIETYELVIDPFNNTWQPHINIFDVDVPSPFSVPLNKKQTGSSTSAITVPESHWLRIRIIRQARMFWCPANSRADPCAWARPPLPG
jgi:hypothetical protein